MTYDSTAQPIYDGQGRPTYPTRVSPESMERARQEASQRTQRAIDEHKKQVEAAKAEQERLQADAARVDMEQYEEEARAAFLSSGGTVAEFTAAWPELRRRRLIDTAVLGLK